MPIIKYSTEEEKKQGLYKSINNYKQKNKEMINEKAKEKVYCEHCHKWSARSAFSRHLKLETHLRNRYGKAEYLYKIKIYDEEGEKKFSYLMRKMKDIKDLVRGLDKGDTYTIKHLF